MKHIFKKLRTQSGHNEPSRSPAELRPISGESDHRTDSAQSPVSPSADSSPSAEVSAAAATATGVGADDRIDFFSCEEEFQIQLAIAISVSSLDSRDDRDCERIRGGAERAWTGQNRIGSRREGGEAAESLSRRYWDYNVIDYAEKVVDGFYDIYGFSTHSAQGKMPSFTDIQATLGNPGFEVVIVNRAVDPALKELQQIAQCFALDCPADMFGQLLVQRLSDLVSEHMGGPVRDANIMLAKWMERSSELRVSFHTGLFLIGSLNVGLSRHRALLFKVLADIVGLSCRLVKGSHYTGIDDDAVNIIKFNEREFLVDLMAAPGTLIPADSFSNKDSSLNTWNLTPSGSLMLQRANDLGINLSRQATSPGECKGADGRAFSDNGTILARNSSLEKIEPRETSDKLLVSVGNTSINNLTSVTPIADRPSQLSSSPYNGIQVASVVNDGLKEKQNVLGHPKDTKEDFKDLFADLNPFQMMGAGTICVQKKPTENNTTGFQRRQEKISPGSSRPPLPMNWKSCAAHNDFSRTKHHEFVEGLFPRNNQVCKDYDTSLIALTRVATPEKPFPSVNATLASGVSYPIGASNGEGYSSVCGDQVMRSNTHQQNCLPSNRDISKTGIVHKPFESLHKTRREGEECHGRRDILDNDEADHTKDPGKNIAHKHEIMKYDTFLGSRVRLKDKEDSSLPLDSGQSRLDPMLDDVAELEIPWEDLAIGERIGLGSYGEVYHADWNGKEVAVKKFLDQDFLGDALDEFRSEVRIMRRLRHPNVVLFMGAVTRPPNLSIVTEFLPRGSLHRILHRPTCQIDEKRRIKMALDVAKGMNCLHTSIPTIVHRDLKSPNLLVDKNWNVKVCDFGLSRLKHNTFLSSRSNGGTPEWMAPEVLRNEPSNEKCDVYSFGVILWELATLRLPWSGMNQMQVVGAVGFQNRRLDIPKELDPLVARIIWECWQTDPNLRPSFAQLLTALDCLQRLVIHPHSDQQIHK